MLAPSAGTLPRGHALVEPYLYDVVQYGSYDGNGKLQSAPHSNGFGSLTYIIYGLADRLSVGVIPTAGYTSESNGLSSSAIGLGDLGVLAQYQILKYRPGSAIPMTSIAVQETLPSGTYDQLGNRPSDGIGGGAYATKLSLYTQNYAWMPKGRILRLRLNASQTFSSSTNVDGVSVYGAAAGFHGSAKPGNALSIDAAAEYSITRNWVLASDVVYGYNANTRVSGSSGVTNLGTSESWAIAPALEYNWSPNVGILFGMRFIPAGRNSGASITPAIAVNYVHQSAEQIRRDRYL